MGRRQSGGRRMHRYALRDDQWDKIKDFLPGREGHVGGTAADNRLFVDAVIYRYRTGIPWRDLPERYGYWKAVHRRYRRWCESGVFMRVFEIMSRDADNEFVMLDATIVRADLAPDALIADKGYDSDAFVEKLEARDITPVIPPKANRKEIRDCDFALYCERNLVERFFNKIKHYRAIATRFDKLANTFLAGVLLVCVVLWLN